MNYGKTFNYAFLQLNYDHKITLTNKKYFWKLVKHAPTCLLTEERLSEATIFKKKAVLRKMGQGPQSLCLGTKGLTDGGKVCSSPQELEKPSKVFF